MNDHRRLYLLCAMLVAWMAGSEALKDAASIGYVAAWHFVKKPAVPPARRFDAPGLAPLIVFDGASGCKRLDYVEKVNAGVALLRGLGRPDSRVLVLDFTNPFSFALGLRSPRGDAAWWQHGTNIAPGAFPPADSVFREVTVVMVPKCEEDVPTVHSLAAAYGGYVRAHYQPTAQNEAWTLLTRRQTSRALSRR